VRVKWWGRRSWGEGEFNRKGATFQTLLRGCVKRGKRKLGKIASRIVKHAV